VGDLLLWNENFVRAKVGGPALVAELQRRGRLSGGREIEYAEGLVVGNYRGVAEVSHGGATAGYRAFLARYPQQHLSVALLCNLSNVDPSALAHDVADIFLTGEMTAASPPAAVVGGVIRLSRSELSTKAGLYRNGRTNEPLRLIVRDGTLQVDPVGELMPVTRTLFQSPDGQIRIIFDLGSGERPTAMRILMPDGDTIPYVPAAEVTPSAAQLADYVGEYYSGEAEARYTVAVEDGLLVLHRRPNLSIPLVPRYADAFTAPGLGMVLFTRNRAGGVDGLSLALDRVRDLRFTRTSR